jgi:hypothetical protein
MLGALLGDIHVIHYETLDENQLVLVQEEDEDKQEEEALEE